jgi:hypothetical protein
MTDAGKIRAFGQVPPTEWDRLVSDVFECEDCDTTFQGHRNTKVRWTLRPCQRGFQTASQVLDQKGQKEVNGHPIEVLVLGPAGWQL